jgi:molybdenum cofactor biosynthesis enzyme MoaA
MGAEPTMRNDLTDIIVKIRKAGHRCTLLTNGLKLASIRYTQSLKEAKLSHVYLSLNGVDNDDWYESIDELRCAKVKVMALENIQKTRFIVDTGTILCKGVNEDAPARLLHLFKQKNIEHAMIRFKNVGQHGRYLLESIDNWSMDDMIQMCAEQYGLSVDYINSWKDKPIYGAHVEDDTFMFPLNPESTGKMLHRSGIWVKIADWDSHMGTRPYPFMDQTRRGRITEDFKVAPLPAHIVANEGGY